MSDKQKSLNSDVRTETEPSNANVFKFDSQIRMSLKRDDSRMTNHILLTPNKTVLELEHSTETQGFVVMHPLNSTYRGRMIKALRWIREHDQNIKIARMSINSNRGNKSYKANDLLGALTFETILYNDRDKLKEFLVEVLDLNYGVPLPKRIALSRAFKHIFSNDIKMYEMLRETYVTWDNAGGKSKSLIR
jgi:hypothetical protein